jgi:hypothetical protein
MNGRTISGILLIILGLCLLVNNLGWAELTPELLFAVLLLTGGVLVLAYYALKERVFLLLTSGLCSLPWGMGILLYEAGWLSGEQNFIFFLLGLAGGLLSPYIHNTRYWWAVLPGGFLMVGALIWLLNSMIDLSPGLSHFLLFFGFSLTFFYLYLIPEDRSAFRWAAYSGVGTFLVGLFFLYFRSYEKTSKIAVSLFLIGVGSFLLIRSLRRKTAASAE